MEITRVEYTVQQEYVEQNKANIRQVMADLKALKVNGFKYWSQLAEDGVSFMHIAMKENATMESPLNGIRSFDVFRKALKESKPVSPPKSKKFELVGSGHDIF